MWNNYFTGYVLNINLMFTQGFAVISLLVRVNSIQRWFVYINKQGGIASLSPFCAVAAFLYDGVNYRVFKYKIIF